MSRYLRVLSLSLLGSMLLHSTSAHASAIASYSVQWAIGLESPLTGPPPSALALSPADQRTFSVNGQAIDISGDKGLAVTMVNQINLTNTDPALTGQSVTFYGNVFSFEEAQVSNMQAEIASVYEFVSSPNFLSPTGVVSNKSCTTDQFGRQFTTPFTCTTNTNPDSIFGLALIPAPGDQTVILITTKYGYDLKAVEVSEPSSIAILCVFVTIGLLSIVLTERNKLGSNVLLPHQAGKADEDPS